MPNSSCERVDWVDMSSEELIIVIQPETVARDRIARALHELDIPLRSYAAFADCLQELQSLTEPIAFCVIAPLSTQSMSGLEFQRELIDSPHLASIVFCVEEPNIETIVDAMRCGAVGVVEANDDSERLIGFVAEGLARSRAQLRWETTCRTTLELLSTLNLGEHQVLQGIMAGKLNKEIAQQLNVSIRTVEQRRREVFKKMHVQHPASLARKVMEAAQVPRRVSCSVRKAVGSSRFVSISRTLGCRIRWIAESEKLCPRNGARLGRADSPAHRALRDACP